jgi:hypothetical protein
MILEAIEKQVGGTAAATANASDKMKVVFSQLQEQLGGALLPIFERFTSFLVDSVFPTLRTLGDRFIPPIAEALGKVGDYISNTLVPIFRDRLIPFIERLGEIISTYVVPIVRDLFVKAFEGLRDIFDIVVTKIRENRDNIEKYGNALQDIGRFIVNYVAPVLVKTLGFAFDVVSKAIGPAIDAFFGFMGVLGTLGSFVVKIASFVVDTIVGMVNGVIDLINKAIGLANKVKGINITPLGRVEFTMPSFGGAPTVPGATGEFVPDRLDRISAGGSGAPSFSLPDIGAPSLSSGGGGGGGSSSAGGGAAQGFGNLAASGLQNIGISSSGALIDFATGELVNDQRTVPDVVNITINTVTTDGEFPNKVADALQQYNLYNGPLDVQIAV